MKALSDKEWGVIPIIKLFSELTPGKISNASAYLKSEFGNVEYVAATNKNNGCLYFFEDSDELNKKVQKGNCIGFIKDGNGSAGYAIYKKESFVSTVNVIYGYSDWLNSFTGLFFVAAQDKIEDKYSHGYKRNQQHLRGDKVMLPVKDDGVPDYDYMADYVRKHKEAMLAKHREYAEKRIAEIGDYVNIPALDKKGWGELRIEDLFEVTRPAARNKDNYQKGDIPFVASGRINNGVMKFCAPQEDESLDEGNCITVSPVDGSTFYQPKDFLGRGGAGSSILMLRNERLTQYQGLFIARAIEKTCSKYTYGHMGNKDSIKRERIMLPINDSGKPDFDYMEQYVKNMMLRKYKQYLLYLHDRKNSKKPIPHG